MFTFQESGDYYFLIKHFVYVVRVITDLDADASRVWVQYN
jgi:hypothetical protein